MADLFEDNAKWQGENKPGSKELLKLSKELRTKPENEINSKDLKKYEKRAEQIMADHGDSYVDSKTLERFRKQGSKWADEYFPVHEH